MSAEGNKAIVRRAFEEIWKKGNVAVADELFAADYVRRTARNPARGPGEIKQTVSMLRKAFPDLDITVEDLVAEGDRVVVRWSARGTHQGDFGGVAPQGKQVTTGGITLSRVANGKIQEEWAHWDYLGLMRQLGRMPGAG